MNIFEKASKLKVRFGTSKGLCNTEDLWDLPLTQVDRLAVSLHAKLESTDTVSFLTTVTPTNTLVKLQFDIVKSVLDNRVTERDAKVARAAKADQKKRILALIASKQDEQFAGQSIEDLTAELDKLGA